MITVHLLITGKVQGVFFRQSSKKIANELSLKGWIRNTNDGKVESMITGAENSVNEFIAWCRKGPLKARVDRVDVEKRELTYFFQFEIVRNA